MLEKRTNLPVVIVNDELQNISKDAYDGTCCDSDPIL